MSATYPYQNLLTHPAPGYGLMLPVLLLPLPILTREWPSRQPMVADADADAESQMSDVDMQYAD